MRPRPRSRRKAVEYVPPEELLEEIRTLRAGGEQPVAIILGRREWDAIRVQPGSRGHITGIVDSELCFDRLWVLVLPRASRPQIMLTWEEVAEVQQDVR